MSLPLRTFGTSFPEVVTVVVRCGGGAKGLGPSMAGLDQTCRKCVWPGCLAPSVLRHLQSDPGGSPMSPITRSTQVHTATLLPQAWDLCTIF